jgi:hypothetical protein
MPRVSLARWPMLFSFLPMVMPLDFASTMKPLMPLWPPLGSVFARTKNHDACPAPVIHIFWPFITYLSPCLTAVVLMPATSLPALGSVTA